MTEKRPYKIPEYIVQDLNQGQPFSDAEGQEIENIFAASERFQYPATDTEASWQLLKSRMENPLVVTKRPVTYRQFAMFKWAAAAVVFLTIGVGIWQFQKHSATNTANFTAIYKTSDNMELVSLPDGTTINLNSFTELEVKAMNSTERIVSLLSGEAFFNVKHNQLPFKVETGKGDVVVTGTEFNIKNRKELPFAVYLKAGKVSFRTPEENLEMEPGECLKEEGDEGFEVSRATANSQCAWLMNKVVFESEALSRIITELEVIYKVKFKYDEKLSAEKYNFVCETSLKAGQVAELLSKLTGSKVTIE